MDLQEFFDLKMHSDTHTNLTYIRSCLAEVEKQCEIMDKMRQDAEGKVEEWNKDDEIVRLEEKIVQLCRKYSEGFNPSEEQWKKIEKWQERHINRKHKPKQASDQLRKYDPNDVSFTYEFGYTHLGTMGTVVCEKCKADAFRKSLGNKDLYNKIMKDKNAEYFIGEV